MTVATAAIAGDMFSFYSFFIIILTNVFLDPFNTSNGDDSINSTNSGRGSRRDTSRAAPQAAGVFFLYLFSLFITLMLILG